MAEKHISFPNYRVHKNIYDFMLIRDLLPFVARIFLFMFLVLASVE